jgi:hypothetical protein
MKNLNKITIPNWAIFSTSLVSIHIYEVEDEYERIVYQSALVFLLEDGRRDQSIEESRAIVIMTNITNYEVDDCVLETVNYVNNMFNKISKMALVFDLENALIDKIDIGDLMLSMKDYEEDILESMRESRNKTIH